MSRALLAAIAAEAEKRPDAVFVKMESEAGVEIGVNYVVSQGGVTWFFFTYFESPRLFQGRMIVKKSMFVFFKGACHALRRSKIDPVGVTSTPPPIPSAIEVARCPLEDRATEHELTVLLTALRDWRVVSTEDV